MISILCPTRKRYAEFLRMFQSIMETAADPKNVEVVAYLDEDDPTDYENLCGTLFLRGKRIVLSNMWNKCASKASGDIFGQANDDIIFRTHGWDAIVENEFAKVPDRIAMVHGSDGSEGASGS